VNYNYDWWIDNREAVVNRFNKWLLSCGHERIGPRRLGVADELEKKFDRTTRSMACRSNPLGRVLTLLGRAARARPRRLMMIAGFETPSAGDIAIDGQSVVGMPPYRRNIGMVFQN